MRKYLIQDITPPEKKHVTHPHKAKIVHDEEEKPIKKSHPHPAHVAHKVVHHAPHVVPKSATHEEEDISVLIARANSAMASNHSADILLTTISKPEQISPTAPTNIPKDISSKIEKTSVIEEEKITTTIDPRTMLVDKIIEVSPKSDENDVSYTPSYFNDAENVDIPAKAWHYSGNTKQEDLNNPRSSTPVRPIGIPELSKNFITPAKTWMPWILGMIIVAVLSTIGLNYYSGVDVKIIQKQDNIPMDEKITAVKTPQNNELSYSVVVATTSVSREVVATEEKVVTAKASGKIIVYNTQTVVQRLIKNTRFQSTRGKIYRINDSINIPKATVKAGKTIPGSIEVTVYADEAGPDFNSEPTDFTVPGLKDSKIYKMIYARSKGSITGGTSGATKSVSDEDLKQASDELRVQLETKLRTEVRSLVGSWSTEISYDSGVVVELGVVELVSTQSSASDRAIVSQEGTIYLVTFHRKELENTIVKSLIPTFKGEAVSISNLDGMQVEIPKMSGEELMSGKELTIILKGTPSLEWIIDETEIKTAIIGIPKKDFNSTMKQFSTVERAVATIRPVWKTSFPLDVNDIKIEIVTKIPE